MIKCKCGSAFAKGDYEVNDSEAAFIKRQGWDPEPMLAEKRGWRLINNQWHCPVCNGLPTGNEVEIVHIKGELFAGMKKEAKLGLLAILQDWIDEQKEKIEKENDKVN
jgi:rubredoxin